MIVGALLLAAQAPAAEPLWNCADPQVQQEMNHCAQQDFLAADAELNAQWKTYAALMKRRDHDTDGASEDGRPGYFANLLAAQRAWLRYRDAHCTSEGDLFRGGSMEPLIVSTCKARLTRQRTAELRDLAQAEG